MISNEITSFFAVLTKDSLETFELLHYIKKKINH